MTAQEVLTLTKDKGIRFVDVKFCDFPGQWQHFAIPIHTLDESTFEEGLGFDGSSIRGWQAINESDMLVMPDPSTAFIDPFYKEPTLSLTCSIQDPITHELYSRDPRNVATKCEAYLLSSGIADIAYIGPEAEFYMFDNVRFGQGAHYSIHEIDSEEGIWNSDSDDIPNLGHRPRHKEGYFPVPPLDTHGDIRSEMVTTMLDIGLDVEAHHHEVGTGGQGEIDLKFQPLRHMGDQMMAYKYCVKNVARRNGKTATFMPKPIFNDNGTGMHVHSSLWKGDKPLFAGDGYAGLSEMAMHYIGGILKHARALIAFTSPTTNSFKRLVPGFEAPVNLAYSKRNRSAACRIPMYSSSPAAKRIEFRCPDPTANPYYCFAAIVMAGLDGIRNKIEPGDSLDKDIYDLSAEELADVPQVPGSLDEALEALEEDHAFLTEGDVFTQDVIDTWISYKRENEVDEIRLRPHPYEFYLYYDA